MRRRARFATNFAEHDFLLQRAAEDILGRLNAVTRDFSIALDLGAHHGVLSQLLLESGRVGTVISADPCASCFDSVSQMQVACEDDLLPFRNSSLDLVVSGLSLQLVNDIPGALLQIRHALKPDGLLLAAALGGQTLHELRDAMAVAEDETCGGVSPRVAPFADIRDYGGLLQRAGFALPVTDIDTVTVTYDTAFDLMRELRAMGASNMLAERRRTPVSRRFLMRAAEIYAERYSNADGRIPATFEIIHMAGWSPDASQPQPLKPGSAQMRLADALSSEELPAGEKADPASKKS